MTRPRVGLVVNPTAGRGRAARLADPVRRRLAVGAQVSLHSTDSAAGSGHLLATAAASCDALVVLGGDGMVHLAAQVLAEGDTPLGIVPAGTGNDTAHALGLPMQPLRAADAALAALSEGSVRRLDLGRTDTGRWWVGVLCAGFDSAVNERANRMRWPSGPHRYDLAIAAELAHLAPREFTITADGVEHRLSATLVAIGNGPQYGGGKKIAPDARMDDGEFALTVVGPVNRRTLVRLAPTLPRAGHIGHPAVRTCTAREVALSAAATVAYADGERLGELPISTTCIPAALPVLDPRLG